MDKEAVWNQAEDEAVEVNQRALIDKILARYSGKFTVFRELLQNADDAGAKHVKIHFETEKYLKMQQTTSEHPAFASSDELGTQRSIDPYNIPYTSHQDVVVSQWRVWNDGAIFGDPDWKRLKKIADGNPDEHKIGAFGVGFYSLFSVTDEPFVTSGSKWMGFHWKDGKDQLMARRGNLPESPDRDPFTTFTMPLRQPGSLPDVPLCIVRFLAGALPFMNTLATFELFLDGTLLALLRKTVDSPVDVDVPAYLTANGATKTNQEDPIPSRKWDWWTPRKLMNVHSVTRALMHINASVMPWAYQRVPDMERPALLIVMTTNRSGESERGLIQTHGRQLNGQRGDSHQNIAAANEKEILESSVTLNLFTADARVQLDEEMAVYLKRAMQKKSPKNVKVGLLYTTHDDFVVVQTRDPHGIFSGVRANLNNPKSSRIYIGHATGQTTGIAGHISSRFIPTVEREAIDLVDQNVSVWNKELLQISGYLSRVVYETEVSIIHTERKICNAERSSIASLEKRYLHLTRFFAFYPSTPASDVSEIMQTAFYDASNDILVLATLGVMPASKVRALDAGMDRFMRSTPVFPKVIIESGGHFIDTLRRRKLVRGVTPDEVITELKGPSFTEEEMICYIKWRSTPLPKLGLNAQGWRQIGNIGRFSMQTVDSTSTGTRREVELKEIETYINPDDDSPVPRQGPFPRSTLPPKLSKIEGVKCTDYNALFGWRPFSLRDWIAYLCDQSSPFVFSQDITRSSNFAEEILLILAKSWRGLSQLDKNVIVQSLSRVTCIPTQLGLKQPKSVYFFAEHIFKDLPMVKFQPPVGPIPMVKGEPIATLLDMLGVQKHVDLQLVFQRMISNGAWTIPQLTKYLVGVQPTLTKEDMKWLQEKEAFCSEDLSTHSTTFIQLFTIFNFESRKARLSALYEPMDEMRELGLPILDWRSGHPWQSSSDEARFLISLGLKTYPALDQLLQLATGSDRNIREKALRYFFNYRKSHYRDCRLDDYNHINFIPAVQPSGWKTYARRDRVFLNEKCAMLGFDVVRSDIADDARHHLDISMDPPANQVVEKLRSASLTEGKAKAVFEYLSCYPPTPKFRELQERKFIPARKPRSNELIMVSPKECFLRQGSLWTKLYPDLFILVDFGLDANHFLEKCGVRRDASINDLAKSLTSNPQESYGLVGSRDRFKGMLGEIAKNFQDISSDVQLEMRRGTILLDDTAVSAGPSGDNPALLKADEIIIIDNMGAYVQFREHIRAAPRDDTLENLYNNLGSPRLSQLISEEYIPGVGNIDDNDEEEIRQRILARLWFFFEGDMKQKARTQVDWMEDPTNFVVKRVLSLTVKSTFSWKGKVKERSPEAAAGCSRDKNGGLTLYIAKLNWHEIAKSLCLGILKKVENSDIFLLQNLFLASLESLNLSYDVERIQKRRANYRQSKLGDAQDDYPTVPLGDPGRNQNGYQDPKPIMDTKQLTSSEQGFAISGSISGSFFSVEAGRSSTHSLRPRTKRDGTRHDQNSEQTTTRKPLTIGDQVYLGQPGSADVFTDTDGVCEKHPDPASENVDFSAESGLESIQRAIGSYTPHHREKATGSKEGVNIYHLKSLIRNWSPSRLNTKDIVFIGNFGGVRIYAEESIPTAREWLFEKKMDCIECFISIIQPLERIFGLQPASLHIYYGDSGPDYALCREGAFFLNLRYFETKHMWMDDLQRDNQFEKGLISWYYIIACLIANNLIGPDGDGKSQVVEDIVQSHLTALIDELHHPDTRWGGNIQTA